MCFCLISVKGNGLITESLDTIVICKTPITCLVYPVNYKTSYLKKKKNQTPYSNCCKITMPLFKIKMTETLIYFILFTYGFLEKFILKQVRNFHCIQMKLFCFKLIINSELLIIIDNLEHSNSVQK